MDAGLVILMANWEEKSVNLNKLPKGPKKRLTSQTPSASIAERIWVGEAKAGRRKDSSKHVFTTDDDFIREE